MKHQPDVAPSHLYEPLDESTGEIRLLEILPPQPDKDEVVACRLFKSPLKDVKLQYAALSYVWGDAAIREDVIVNGVVLPVTINLAAALKRIRNNTTLRVERRPITEQIRSKTDVVAGEMDGSEALNALPLWVDAVCINQDDIEERNKQVTRMRSIYGDAANVISWIGEPGERHTDLCFGFMRGLAGALNFPWDVELRKLTFKDLKPGIEWLAQQPKLCRRDRSAGGSGNVYWNALIAFYGCRYWRRIWILQEVVLARSPQSNLYICGDAHITFANMFPVASFLRRLAQFQVPCPRSVDAALWLFLTPGKVFYSLCCPLITINLFRLGAKSGSVHVHAGALFCEATNPRDYVYGLLGIVNAPLDVDYSKSVREVYLDWMAHMLKNGAQSQTNASSLPLDRAGIGIYESNNDLNLPSWMTNLARVPPHQHHVPLVRGGERGDVPQLFQVSPPALLPGGVLSIHGTSCDDVEQNLTIDYTRTTRTDVHADGHPEILLPCLKVVEEVGEARYKGRKIPQLVALLQTLFLGRDPLNEHETLNTDRPASLAVQWVLKLLHDHTFEESGLFRDHPGERGVSSASQLLRAIETHFGIEDGDERRRWWDSVKRSVDGIRAFQLVRLTETFRTKLEGCEKLKWFRTKGGHLGLGPYGTLPGDRVCILDVAMRPVLLRNVGGCWRLVGTCFAYGLSQGEPLEGVESGELKFEEFLIY